ncbi:DUF397 domain-containing protein [Streptomyces sp. NBC_01136]|uniref:DUF397 domain-containing protein n=1 Tax=unclassified Streptomyces TaxID=2593676 RepID=UPI00324B25E0|nr:DUF397 domain-containing protein [Streptomyces sp. NBC_01136]
MSIRELHWFKSSYSDSGEPGDCVEVALDWFKSSHSDSGEAGDCVEIAVAPTTIRIRDSKTPAAPHLTVAATTWADFLTYASSNRQW